MTGRATKVRDILSGSPLLAQAARSGWTLGQRIVRRRKLKRYLRSTDLVRVMIGSGPSHVEGWLATDLLPSRPDVMLLDAEVRFPFRPSSVDRIHTEHMIEHIDHPTGRHMLAECHRVLKPGGRIRIATPDFEVVVALAGPLRPDLAEQMRAANTRCGLDDSRSHDPIYAVNRLFSEYGHRFLYSEGALRRELDVAGFVDITRHEVSETADREFAGVDQHGTRMDSAWNRYVTMVIEASRP